MVVINTQKVTKPPLTNVNINVPSSRLYELPHLPKRYKRTLRRLSYASNIEALKWHTVFDCPRSLDPYPDIAPDEE